MEFPSGSFIINYLFDKKNKVKESFILHNHRFQIIVLMCLMLTYQYKLQSLNKEMRKKICSENKKLRALKDI